MLYALSIKLKHLYFQKVNRKKCNFSINYGFGSILPFDIPELIEKLQKKLMIFFLNRG